MRTRAACHLLLLAALLAAAPAAEARRHRRAPEREAGALNATPWARPLAGGPVRVLLIAPAAGMADAVTLRDQLEAECTAVPLEDPAALESALRGRWDVIAIGNLSSAALPEAAQRQLAARVQSGAGLLAVFVDATGGGPLAELLEGLAYTADPAPVTAGLAPGPTWFRADEGVRLCDAGGLRAVRIDAPGDAPQTHALVPPPAYPLDAHPGLHENAWSLIARALRWLARRDPPLRIARIEDAAPAGPDAEEIPPGLPGEFVEAMRGSFSAQAYRPYVVRLTQPAGRAYRVRTRLRRPGAAMLAETAVTAPRGVGKGQAAFPIEVMAGAGTYWIDVWLIDGDRVADWFTAAVNNPGWPRFEGLECSKTFLLPNDRLEIAAQAPGVAGRQRLATFYARATDALGRIVAQAATPFPPEGGALGLQLDLADLRSPILKLEVFAVDGAPRPFTEPELLAAFRDYRHFAVRLPETAAGMILAAPVIAPAEYNARQRMAALARAGVHAVIAPAGDAPLFHAPFAGLSYWPAMTLPEAGPACPLADAARARHAQRLQDDALLLWAGSSAHYTVPPLPDAVADPAHLDACAACRARFIRFLQSRYDGLDALNEAWGVQFIDWEDIRPVPPETARAEQRFAPAIDAAAFRAAGAAEFAARTRAAIRAVDPEGFAGAAAGEDAWEPANAALWMRAADFAVLPARPEWWDRGPAAQLARTGLALQLALDTATPEAAAHWMWRAAFERAGAVMLAAGDAGAIAALPGGPLAPVFEAAAGVARQLEGGLGALLARAQPASPEVLLYDSPATRAWRATRGDEAPDAAGSALAAALSSLGYPTAWIGPDDALSAGFGGAAAVALPGAALLSAAECDALRRFHDAGGALLAQGMPGTADEHGRARSAPPLADLFEPAAAGAAPRTLSIAADAPPDAAAIDAFLRAALPPERHPRAMPGAGARVYRYGYGEADIAAILPLPGSAARTAPRVEFSHPHRTDLVRGERLRGSGPWSPGLDGLLPRAAAALPYAVEKIVVTVPERAIAGLRLDFAATVAAKRGTPGKHLLAVDLVPKDGLPRRHYRQYLEAAAGSAAGFIPLALNEVPGEYRLHVRDVLSAAEASAPLRIQPNQSNPG